MTTMLLANRAICADDSLHDGDNGDGGGGENVNIPGKDQCVTYILVEDEGGTLSFPDGGVSTHIGPFIDFEDVGSLLTNAEFTLSTVDIGGGCVIGFILGYKTQTINIMSHFFKNPLKFNK